MEKLIKSIGKFNTGPYLYSIKIEALDENTIYTVANVLLMETYDITTCPNIGNKASYINYKPICTRKISEFDDMVKGVLHVKNLVEVIKYVNDKLKLSQCDLEWTCDNGNFVLRRIRTEEVEKAHKRVKEATDSVTYAQAKLSQATTELTQATEELNKLLPQ